MLGVLKKGGAGLKRLILILIFPVLLLSACAKNTDIAFMVDGVAVEKDELVFYMDRLFDSVLFEIEDEYGLIYENRNDYWSAEIGDTTPLEYLKKSAVDEIVRIKVIQIEAKKHGLKSEMQYSAQVKDWKEDNAKRIQADEAGEIVYGVVERSFYTYINTCFLEVQSDLQEKLKQNEIIITENEMRQYYNAHPDYFEGQKYEDVTNTIYGWIFDERYEKYVEELIRKAEITYQDMEVDPQQFE